MKKRYVKPQIAVENFYLAEMISGCSDLSVTFTTTGNCANHYDADSSIDDAVSMGVFTASQSCMLVATEGMQIGSTCYHSSTGVGVFGS